MLNEERENEAAHKETILSITALPGTFRLAYSLDGEEYKTCGEGFRAREGKWIGAKAGIFCTRHKHENDGGYTDYD